MRRHRVSVAVSILSLLIVGCEITNTIDDIEDLSQVTVINYSRHVQPLLTDKCGTCHGGASPDGGLDLSSWDNVIAGSDHGGALIPFDSENSLMIQMEEKLVGGGHLSQVGADSLTGIEFNFLKRWISEGAKGPGDIIPYSDSNQDYLYVANQDEATVSVIAIGSNVVARRIDLQDYGFTIDSKPHHIAVEADGSHWYVSLIGANVVAKFDRDNNLVGQVSFERPGMLAVHPTEDMLFVGRSLTAINPPSSIGLITKSTMEVEEIDVFFARPHALTLDGSSGYVVSGSLDANQIIVVALADTSVSFNFVPGASTLSLVQHAASSSNERLFSSAALTNEVISHDASDPRALTSENRITVGEGPWHPVYTPDGDHVYLGNLGANTVTVIDARTVSVAKVISGNGLAQPHGSAVSEDGRYVYISNRNASGDYTPRFDLGDNANTGTIVVIDTQTDTIAKVIEVGAFATGIGVKAR